MKKAILIILGIFVVAGLAWYLFSIYLVSKLDGRGTVPPDQTLAPYSSEDGVSFMYPDTYGLSSHPGGPGEGDTLVLLPKGYVAPPNSEGPPAITMSIFATTTPLESWIRENPRSNFGLSFEAPASTNVGGESAFSYEHGGLYNYDAFAVAHGGKIFLFEAGWNAPQDQIRADFQNLVSSVQFTE